jgi:hypothetical protein
MDIHHKLPSHQDARATYWNREGRDPQAYLAGIEERLLKSTLPV